MHNLWCYWIAQYHSLFCHRVEPIIIFIIILLFACLNLYIELVTAKRLVQWFTHKLEYQNHLCALGYKSYSGCLITRAWGDRVSLTEWPLLWTEPVGHWMWHICISLIRASALTVVCRCPAAWHHPLTFLLSELKVNDGGVDVTFLVSRENDFTSFPV